MQTSSVSATRKGGREMNLTEELDSILNEPNPRAKTCLEDISYVVWRLFPVIQEIVKRIEELEKLAAKQQNG